MTETLPVVPLDIYNQALVANVLPPDWVNPEPAPRYSALAKTIHPYPTQAEAIKRIADAYNRTRLTPFLKALFAKWLAWTR